VEDQNWGPEVAQREGLAVLTSLVARLDEHGDELTDPRCHEQHQQQIGGPPPPQMRTLRHGLLIPRRTNATTSPPKPPPSPATPVRHADIRSGDFASTSSRPQAPPTDEHRWLTSSPRSHPTKRSLFLEELQTGAHSPSAPCEGPSGFELVLSAATSPTTTTTSSPCPEPRV
jgi:hypothetical protein